MARLYRHAVGADLGARELAGLEFEDMPGAIAQAIGNVSHAEPGLVCNGGQVSPNGRAVGIGFGVV